MEYTKSLISTAMARWGNSYLYIIGAILIYIILYYFIRENSLINDELALFHYLKDFSFNELWSLNWSNAFKFADSAALNDTPYYRPILNYIYYFGFNIYEAFKITPLTINWLLLLYLGIVVDDFLKKTTRLSNRGLYVFFYLLLPFNFETAFFFPNLSDILIHILAIKLLLSLSELNEFGISNTIYYFFLILFGFLVKEAALILAMIPIASSIVSTGNKGLLKKKYIIYLIIFTISFLSYYILRMQFTTSVSLDFDIMGFTINYIKGIFNFIFLTQDINLAAIVILPITLTLFLYIRHTKNIKLIIYSVIIIAPVALLQPDDRFFHISYFVIFLLLIDYKSKKIKSLVLITVFIVFLYKSYSTYAAHKIREHVRIEFNNNKMNNDKTTIAILPYRHGNEAEIFLNGINQYLGKQKLIPVLVKEKLIYKDMAVAVESVDDTISITSQSQIRIPYMKTDSIELFNSNIYNKNDLLLLINTTNNIKVLNFVN